MVSNCYFVLTNINLVLVKNLIWITNKNSHWIKNFSQIYMVQFILFENSLSYQNFFQ